MLYEVLGDIWVVDAIPSCRTICIDNPEAPRPADRGAAPPAARGRTAQRVPPTRARASKVLQLLPAAREAVQRFERRFPEVSRAAQARPTRFARHTRADNIRFDAYARVIARHRRHRLARRVAVRRADAGHGSGDSRLVRDCIELGLTVIPRGGGTGYTGGAVPLTPLVGGHQHREARRLGAVEQTPLPAPDLGAGSADAGIPASGPPAPPFSPKPASSPAG